MNSDRKSVLIDDWEVSFLQFGNGKQLLFAFHGYGQNANIFKYFEEYLGVRFTIISFDLLFHGALKDQAIPEPYFSRAILKKQLNYFLQLYSVKSFSVIGYSLGGKLAMNCVEVLPDKIDQIILMAPDGIKINPFYKFVTHTLIGKKLYQNTIDNPGLVFFINQLSVKLGFINQKIFRFVNDNLESKEKRQTVLDAWLVYSRMLPNINRVAELINSHKIKLSMFFGKYDSIIPLKKGKKLIEKINDKQVAQLLDTGHNLFTEREIISKRILE